MVTAATLSFPELRTPSTCAYVKLYPNEKGVDDRLLVEIIRPLIARLIATSPFRYSFFIRYQDPEYHLRFRIFAPPSDMSSEAARDILDRELRQALGSEWPRLKFVHDEYELELDRYGGELGVRVAEQIFAASSEAILDFFTMRAKEPQLSKLEFAITSAEALFEGIGLSPAEREQTLRDYFPIPEDALDQLKQSIPAAVTERIASIVETAQRDPLEHWRGQNESFVKILEKLRETIARYREVLAEVSTSSGTSIPRITSSYYHMHLNRLALFPSEEMVIRAFRSSVL